MVLSITINLMSTNDEYKTPNLDGKARIIFKESLQK